MSACSVCTDSVVAPLTLCWSCAALAGDALVFIRRPESTSEHEDVVQALHAVLPGRPTSEAMSLAARGHRAVALVPMDESEKVRDLFRGYDVEVSVVARRKALAPLPAGLRVVVGLTFVAGTLAGLLAQPVLIVTSPLVAVLLWAAAQKRLQRPLAESAS